MLEGKIPIIAAFIFGLLATFLAVKAVNAKRDEISKKWEVVEVLVAKEDIKANTILEHGMLAIGEMPKRYRTDDYLKPTDFNYVEGLRIVYPMSRGEPLKWYKIEGGGRDFDRLTVPKGMRAMTINVSKEGSVGNWVKPNDQVDVVVVLRDPKSRELSAITLLQNITVLTTGKIKATTFLDKMAAKEMEYQNVTLLVTPELVEILALAQDIGKVVLSLRNMEDIKTIDEIESERYRTTINTILTGERIKGLRKRMNIQYQPPKQVRVEYGTKQ